MQSRLFDRAAQPQFRANDVCRVNGSCVKIPSPLDGLVLGKLHLLALPLAMDHRRRRLALYRSEAPFRRAWFFDRSSKAATNPIEKGPAARSGLRQQLVGKVQ